MAPYLTLLPEGAGQREHALRKVFNGLRSPHREDGGTVALDAERPATRGLRSTSRRSVG